MIKRVLFVLFLISVSMLFTGCISASLDIGEGSQFKNTPRIYQSPQPGYYDPYYY